MNAARAVVFNLIFFHGFSPKSLAFVEGSGYNKITAPRFGVLGGGSIQRSFGRGLLYGAFLYAVMVKRRLALSLQNWPYTSGSAAFSALLSSR